MFLKENVQKMQLNMNDLVHFNLYYLYLDWLLLSSVIFVVLVQYNQLQPFTKLGFESHKIEV